MRVQVFSDLHLDFAKGFQPEPAADAQLLILPGDVGHTPRAIEQFKDWPVPVLYVPGNHEFDRGDYDDVRRKLPAICERAGVRLLDRSTWETVDPDAPGRRVRFVGATRWCDFDLLGRNQRQRCSDAAERYLAHMKSSRGGRRFDAAAVRDVAMLEREWLDAELRERFGGVTVAVTHFAPSGRSADPRYGLVPGTASFCNNDEDLLALADVWIHGHLHCQHDYVMDNARRTRVVCNPRGFEHLGESTMFQPTMVVEI